MHFAISFAKLESIVILWLDMTVDNLLESLLGEVAFEFLPVLKYTFFTMMLTCIISVHIMESKTPLGLSSIDYCVNIASTITRYP